MQKKNKLCDFFFILLIINVDNFWNLHHTSIDISCGDTNSIYLDLDIFVNKLSVMIKIIYSKFIVKITKAQFWPNCLLCYWNLLKKIFTNASLQTMGSTPKSKQSWLNFWRNSVFFLISLGLFLAKSTTLFWKSS